MRTLELKCPKCDNHEIRDNHNGLPRRCRDCFDKRGDIVDMILLNEDAGQPEAISKKILILDIETTGFLNQGGLIVEIGAASLDLDTGKTEIVLDFVCREAGFDESHTEGGKGWIFQNSTLTPEMVAEALTLDELRDVVQDTINEYPLGSTAYNNVFDNGFLEDREFTFIKKLA